MAAGFGPIFGGRRPADIAREVFGRPRRHHRWWLDRAVRDRAVCICVIAVDLRGMGGSESSSRLKPDRQRRSLMTQAHLRHYGCRSRNRLGVGAALCQWRVSSCDDRARLGASFNLNPAVERRMSSQAAV